MRSKYYLFIIIAAVLVFTRCAGPSEPTEYTHTRAGFKITCPAGWKKTDEDSEHFAFRSGDLKLIEVGGFDLELPAEDFMSLSDEEFCSLLMESTLEGVDAYCEEAGIRNYKIVDQGDTQWGGLMGYRVKAGGYSDEALTTMIVDIIAVVHEENSRMYMFASQITESEYEKTKSTLETTITSFQVVQ